MATQCMRGRKQNRSNPRAGSKVQQTCRPECGENRQSREERQRRKESNAWQRRTEAFHLSRWKAGQDAIRRNGGGVFFGKPQERKFDRTRWSTAESKGSAVRPTFRANRSDRTESLKTTGRKEGRVCAGNCTRRQHRESLGDPAQCAEGQGGKQRKPNELHLMLTMMRQRTLRRALQSLRP